jgi:hypothetical protein
MAPNRPVQVGVASDYQVTLVVSMATQRGGGLAQQVFTRLHEITVGGSTQIETLELAKFHLEALRHHEIGKQSLLEEMRKSEEEWKQIEDEVAKMDTERVVSDDGTPAAHVFVRIPQPKQMPADEEL